MSRYILSILTFLFPLFASAQPGITTAYDEPADNYAYDRSGWARVNDGLNLTWTTRDEHALKYEAPAAPLVRDTTVRAWRGERIGVEALLYTTKPMQPLRVSLGTLAGPDGGRLSAECGQARFVRYVLSDEKEGCGANPRTSTTRLRPDVIDRDEPLSIEANSVRPAWVTVEVPRDAAPGRYTAPLLVSDAATGRALAAIVLRVEVLGHTLPASADYAFRLDYWQQPFSVARYYGLEPWSQEHFDALRPFMEMLRRAGQRCVTATLFYEPWGEQSNDPHGAMVKTVRLSDGSWQYDYTVFDRWVEFAAGCGITGEINCYSMIPWNKTFRYYDEALRRDTDLVCEVGSPEYEALWTPFLKAFAKHLRTKGWFDRTAIAMDERGLEDMLRAYDLLQRTVPGMKMVLAGNRHEELVDKLSDYSIASGQRFTPEEISRRRARGWHSTAYYCCSEPAPNALTHSLPAENAYWPLFCFANGFDGLLHWSFIDWTDDPLRDSRFKLFPAGDTYLVYPGPRSSVRYERLLEGIQAAEKARILRERYTADGDTAALQRLAAALDPFAEGVPNPKKPVAESLNELEALLNNY